MSWRALRSIAPYLALVVLVWLAVTTVEAREAGLPARTELPWPTVAVRGLRLDDTPVGFGFEAQHARPRAARGAITLGGWQEGLDLEGVRVELGRDAVLSAPRGWYDGERLMLQGRVVIERGARVLLEAGQVEVSGDRLRFAGLVVMNATDGRSTAVDLDASVGELLNRLR